MTWKDVINNVNGIIAEEKDEFVAEYEAQKGELVKSRDEWTAKYFAIVNEKLLLEASNKELSKK